MAFPHKPLLESCLDCKFMLQTTGEMPITVCRRFPPSTQLNPEMGAWQTTFTIIGTPSQTWCGEYKKKLVIPN